MRYSTLALAVLAFGVVDCSPPAADAAPVKISGPSGYAGTFAPGDSLHYTLSVGAVAGATGYTWTTTASATNGTWGGMLANTASTAPSIAFAPSAPGGWDSVTFTATVKGTSTTRSSKGSFSVSWKVYRYLASPTSMLVDSSALGPISLMIRSDSMATLASGQVQRVGLAQVSQHGARVALTVPPSSTLHLCAYLRFGSGLVAPVGADTGGCGAIARPYFRLARLVQLPSAAESTWLVSLAPRITWQGFGGTIQ